MTSPLTVLGLGADADERAIKRAYAAKLKTVRPDEDPEGFQRLNEAYRAALQWAMRRPARPAPPVISGGGAEALVGSHPGSPAEPVAQAGVAPEPDAAPTATEGAASFRFRAPPLQPSLPPLPLAPRLQVRAADGEARDEAPRSPFPPRLRIREAPPAAAPPEDAPPPRLRISEATPLPPPAEDAPPWHRLRVSDGLLPDARGAASPDEEVLLDLPLDPPRFYRECLSLAANGSREGFATWLRAQPALWSIARKATVGHGLFDLLRREQPPVPEAQFSTLLEFFAIDDVHSGYDPLVIRQLSTTLHAAWCAARDLVGHDEIRIPTGHDGWPVYGAARTEAALALLDRRQREASVARLATQRHPELLRRWSLWRIFRNVLSPHSVAEVAEAIEALGDASGDRFDPRALRFWRRAADNTRWSWPHTFLVFSRCLAAALGVVAVLSLITLPVIIEEGRWDVSLGFGGGVLLTTFGGWLGYASFRNFVRWQTDDEPSAGALRWLHRATIPLLTLLGLGISLGRSVDAAAVAVLLFATIVAIRRQSARNGALLPHIDWDHHAGWGLLRLLLLLTGSSAFLLLALFTEGGPLFCFVLAGLALMFWAIDLARQRRRAPR